MTNKKTPDIAIGKGRSGPGRPPGSLNKTTQSVKAALEQAFDELGGVQSLVGWARENETEFFKLYAKLLPVQVSADLNHKGSISIVVDTGVPRAPDEPKIDA